LKNSNAKLFLVILLVIVQIKIYGQFPDLAKTPPMGWNSWNAFDLNINSKIIMSVADSMVSKGLAAAGYQYIVIDDGWQIGRDKNGKIIADSTRFPEGIKYLADYLHSKGLKFGIYTCCGTKTCGGRPGSYGYEVIDAKTYAEWGVDFIKVDWCFTDGLDTRTQYKIMSDAIKTTGRPMILSLCEWGISSPWEWGKRIGSMWRTTSDIQDCFDCVRNWGGMGWVPILEKNVNLAPFAGPGHWNDPDMLEVGNKALTPLECKSHFSMWCMLAAPLIAGNNISTMNDTIRDILTASEIIAIDQDELGFQGIRIKNNNGLQVWQKSLSDGSIAVALLNVSKNNARMSVSLEEIGFKNGVNSSIRDLWERKNLNAIKDVFETEVEAHGIVVVKIKGEKSTTAKIKFENTYIKIERGNHRLIQLGVFPSATPIIVTASNKGTISIALAGVNLYKISALNVGNCKIKASTKDGKFNTECNVVVEPSSLPTPWKMNEIRDNKASVFYKNGVYSIESGGSDIWNTNDQFTFISQETDKDKSISARISSQTKSDPWAKSGLMIRESLSPNSAFAMLCVTPGNGLSFQWREKTGAPCNKTDLGAFTLPVYLKLTKSGLIFNAYKSIDGKEWTSIHDFNFNQSFKQQHLVGMEVTAHSSHELNISKFNNVKVEQIENNQLRNKSK
jgi:alpha-galactosidase